MAPIETTRSGSLAARFTATARVLVIEDDDDIATFLRAFFRASGYDIVRCDPTSVEDGLNAVVEHQPDLVLLDVRLRGFSGLALHRRLRSDPAFSFVPILLVSADSGARREAEPSSAGIDGFVQKPFHATTLAALVDDRIAAARRLAGRCVGPGGVVEGDELARRIATEVDRATASGRPVAFALLGTRVDAGVARDVGHEAVRWLTGQILAHARPGLPDHAVYGRTADGELAILLPGTTAAEAATLLDGVIGTLDGGRRLPGGAEVRFAPAAGVAAFPANAADADGLFMAADAALAGALDGGAPVVTAV